MSFNKYKVVIFFKKNSQRIIRGKVEKKKKKTQEAHGCGTLFWRELESRLNEIVKDAY